MGVEKTARACISTGTVLSRFGKPLQYYSLVCGVVDRPRQYYALFSPTPPKTLYDCLGLAHRACYTTSLPTLGAHDGCHPGNDYSYASPNQRHYASRP